MIQQLLLLAFGSVCLSFRWNVCEAKVLLSCSLVLISLSLSSEDSSEDDESCGTGTTAKSWGWGYKHGSYSFLLGGGLDLGSPPLIILKIPYVTDY